MTYVRLKAELDEMQSMQGGLILRGGTPEERLCEAQRHLQVSEATLLNV